MGSQRTLTQPQRLVALLIDASILAVACYVLFGTIYPPLGNDGFWAYSALLSVLVGSKLVTPFYVKPADAIAYAVPAFISLMLVNGWEAWPFIGRAEDMLGLRDQPRAIVFHTKYGREHCHVVWSRVDAENQRAVHLAFDHEKLMRVGVLARERKALEVSQAEARAMQKAAHRAQRDALRHGYRQTVKDVREARERDRPTGLAAFLGRVTGVDLIRRAVHRHQDGQRLKAYRAESRDLKTLQSRESAALEARAKIQAQDMARHEAALAKVEKRELAAFMRDQRTAQRVRDRGEDGAMPSLETLITPASDVREAQEPDVLGAFERARSRDRPEPPDLFAAFKRATEARDEDAVDDSGERPDHDRPPDLHRPDGPGKGKGRER